MGFKMKPGSKEKHSDDAFSVSSPFKQMKTPMMSPLKNDPSVKNAGLQADARGQALTEAYEAAEAAGTQETAPGVYTKWRGSTPGETGKSGGQWVEDRAAKLANDPYSEKEAQGKRDYRASVSDPRTAMKTHKQREGESGQDYYNRIKALGKTKSRGEARRAGLLRKKKK